MTWEEAASIEPQYIAYRVDELGVLYFRYHHVGTVAIVLGRPYRIDNLYDDLDDWQPFTDALYPSRLKAIRDAHQKSVIQITKGG